MGLHIRPLQATGSAPYVAMARRPRWRGTWVTAHSLFGLELALEPQGKIEDALAVAQRFDLAWADADVTLSSSRY